MIWAMARNILAVVMPFPQHCTGQQLSVVVAPADVANTLEFLMK